MSSRRELGCALAVVLAAGSSGCFLDNDVMDASCTPDGPDINLNSDCPYEEGKGPQLPQTACEAKFPSAQSTVSWTDVYGLFNDAARGNCSAGNCHGVEAAAGGGIYLPNDNPDTFYQGLKNATGSVGRPYLVVPPDDPLDSWIHCNVAGTAGGGLIMPKPDGLSTEDAQLVEDWLHAGARGPGQ